jgi:hypothetical protein
MISDSEQNIFPIKQDDESQYNQKKSDNNNFSGFDFSNIGNLGNILKSENAIIIILILILLKNGSDKKLILALGYLLL